MACAECVIFTLAPDWKTADSPWHTVLFECLASSGYYLVGIRLMADIEYYLILRGIENVMKPHDQLYRPEAGGDVAGVHCAAPDDIFPDFIAECLQLLDAKLPHIVRRIDFFKNHKCKITILFRLFLTLRFVAIRK